MIALTKYFLKTGVLLVVGGLCACLAGGLRLYHYLNGSALAGTTPSTRQFVRWVVIPHALVAIGIGLVVFGIILIVKGTIFHVKQQKGE